MLTTNKGKQKQMQIRKDQFWIDFKKSNLTNTISLVGLISKTDGVFQGLARMLRGIARGQSPGEVPRSSPASLRKTPSFLTLLHLFTFYLLFFLRQLSQKATVCEAEFVLQRTFLPLLMLNYKF